MALICAFKKGIFIANLALSGCILIKYTEYEFNSGA